MDFVISAWTISYKTLNKLLWQGVLKSTASASQEIRMGVIPDLQMRHLMSLPVSCKQDLICCYFWARRLKMSEPFGATH